MADEFSRSGDTRPATIDDLYAAMVDANAIVGEQRKRIAELEAALNDCIGMVAIHADSYRRKFGLTDLHPTHADILNRASVLTGGERLSDKLKD